MINMVKLPTNKSSLFLRVAKGHFATSHSHINYYIDVTTQKSRLSEAKAVAKELVAAYQQSTIVDTVLCLDGTQVIGTCLANELTKDGFSNMNAHQTIYVITPEYTTGSQIILRDNLAPMVKGKHVLILAASITTGYTAQAAIEAVNYYGGMVDVYSDLRLQSTVFGTHAEILEMCELHELRRSVTQREADARVAAFGEAFVIDEGCTREELERAARTSVALDKLAEAHRLGSLAYYYAGAAGNAYEDIVTSVIAGNTLLTGRGIPVAGEYEVKNVQAMKIMSLLGAGGCFSEFYGMDFTDDVIVLGHDGPAHFLLGEEKARLVPLPVYHGKPGKGLSIQMSVKHGPVTLLSVVEGRDGISFLLAEGESVPGPVLNIGNINSRYRFPLPAREFIDRWSKAGPSHHCAIGVGHVAGAIRKYAALLGIPVTVVC